ncbi:hypothetical protein QQS21_004008 [Conoideocrella luteorostrata]|uniref:Uncharacterized protein n=1 Tax=Conoideocrella luteorostrata TaxID=1105319 RepID=A0AAJ0G059_9HYPO|nr:hypothetical protein QQS21_004008 [Conoideocrella luteorostrata]
MTQADRRKGLWLVSPRLDAVTYRDKLIGSVVKYPELPIESRIPYRSPKLPKEIVEELDPNPVQVHNVQFWEKNIHDATLRATVQNIIDIFVDRAKESNSQNLATIARVWHMDSPGEKFKDLLGNKDYFNELFDLLQSNHGVGYFITDIVTFMNLEETQSHGSGTGAGASAQVPVDPSTGISVGGGAKFNVLREKGYSACYEGESIVFMGYRKIELVKVTGARAKIRRMLQGEKHGLAVMDRADHWPEMRDLPYEGTVSNFLGDRDQNSPTDLTSAEKERLERHEEFEKIAEELGLDPVLD